MGSRSGTRHRLITSAYIPESVKVRTEEKRGNITIINNPLSTVILFPSILIFAMSLFLLVCGALHLMVLLYQTKH